MMAEIVKILDLRGAAERARLAKRPADLEAQRKAAGVGEFSPANAYPRLRHEKGRREQRQAALTLLAAAADEERLGNRYLSLLFRQAADTLRVQLRNSEGLERTLFDGTPPDGAA